ncbi:GTPase-activating Rap Ran-GAP domain 3 [Pelobates cultripes]|uniref:GTPase-activating Rap Ran-GAP domain 3 n=2 Tax=Pelobates cultripes TaxID=61616 RepID=A0AAD1T2H9_PELCU|nr:GTPase-activating Rap Ran-GAP domain 3 [Pelobates cultripes]
MFTLASTVSHGPGVYPKPIVAIFTGLSEACLLPRVHQNYIGTDAEKNPFFLSVVLSDQNNQRVPQYRAILWRKTGTQKICLSYCPTKTLSVKSILSAMNLDRFEKSPREILNPEIQKDLLVLEEQEGSVNFKFGVLYAKDGQLTDDEMFSNEAGSESFQKLLSLLGDTITLKSWIGYRGGLDTKNGQPSIPVFDKTMQVKQIHILENLDLLIARADKGKDARLYVFRLSSIRKGLEDKQVMKTKYECRDNKLEKTKGCHLYAINTHNSNELRIVAAIRNKLLLITRKQTQLNTFTGFTVNSPSTDSPVDEFQYIREICLSDPPVLMTLVDGPTGENDNTICVAYRHQFDLVNESTGESCRLHHVDASRDRLLQSTIDVYEDGEAGLLLCYNYICYYKKVCPFNGGSPLIQPSASDFHFSWNQVPNAVVCAFPYILAFTTDSIEIRLVVNGNLVHTAVVPELQLVASRSDIYFKATAAVISSSNSSSKDTSSHSSPQTPSGYELPVFPSPPVEGEVQCRNIYKIPLSNLVGRSIERPLKSPLAPKLITTPTSSGISCIPVTHSLSLSRMEIKEIASRTRKELLGLSNEPTTKSEASHRQKKLARKQPEEESKQEEAVRSTSTDRINSGSFESNSEGQRHCSTSSDPDTNISVEESPPFSSSFPMVTSFDEEDIIDLK